MFAVYSAASARLASLKVLTALASLRPQKKYLDYITGWGNTVD